MADVTQILSAIEQGDAHAAEHLLPLVYGELRKLAAHKMAKESPGQTLEPTALVHEAYVRLVTPLASPPSKGGEGGRWNSRGHFFAAAAEAMRRILVENARRKKSRKHGGCHERRSVDDNELVAPEPREDVLALDEALDQLAKKDPLKAQLVKLRYFAGLTLDQAAEMLGISPTTADRYWAYSRAWLRRQISNSAPTPDQPP
jgi:RNA polymerase sigma factor (TIGR02999 family)